VTDTPDGRERRRLLDRFDGLRVADVSDALTYLGRDVHAGYSSVWNR